MTTNEQLREEELRIINLLEKYQMTKQDPLLFALEGSKLLFQIDELVGNNKELREKVKLLL